MNDFDLPSKLAEMSTNIKLILKNQEDHEGRLRLLEQKPVRRWDSLVTGIITGIVGIVIGLLLNGGVAQ